MLLKIAPFIVALFFLGCSDDEKVLEEPVVKEPIPEPKIVVETVYFDFDQNALTVETQASLKKALEILKASPKAIVQIEGHCDERGTVEYNLALGERRAQAVQKYLIGLGIDGKRLPTISYGEEKPAEKGTGEKVWEKNRRAAFKTL